MPGLDRHSLASLDAQLALRRIRRDVKSDFIFAPHFDAVYARKGEELWERLLEELSSGQFEPDLPVILDVPRQTGITRPGAILRPPDRLLYQCLVDSIAPTATNELDPSRSFSHVLVSGGDSEGEMFEPSQKCWEALLDAVRRHCNSPGITWAVRADVAAFFETVDQHTLVNLLRAADCDGGAVNLLEELLASWRERSSRGILQGMFPSDFLGNFYLCGLDGQLEVSNTPSARYVDDIYLFFGSETDARAGLASLCRHLRHDGLHLNERKTHPLPAEQLLQEETYVDQLFAGAREAALQSAFDDIDTYILHTLWDYDDAWEFIDQDQVELNAFEDLFARVDDPEVPSDKVERLCLPFFAVVGSTIAVERALAGFLHRSHQAKLYSSYLASAGKADPEVTKLSPTRATGSAEGSGAEREGEAEARAGW